MKLDRLLAASCLCACAPLAGAAIACSAHSSPTPPRVVELYTSEGCSSCPPADRWLSTLKDRDDVVALGFHVQYWDRLGWPDRFASPEATARQYERNRALGRAGVYTPQVLVDGADWRGWPQLPERAAAPPGAPPRVQLARAGGVVEVQVTAAAAGDARRLGGYWALLEDGQVSRVLAGENGGTTLRHDHVVRRFATLPPWRAADGLTLRVDLGPAPPAAGPRRVAFVVTDERGLRPLQAVVLAC